MGNHLQLLRPGIVPTFIYPKSRQYGKLDEICEQIVHELEKRNWSVSNIKVERDAYGAGSRWWSYVKYITGANFKLWFCRRQGTLDFRHANIAAIMGITIDNRKLCIFEDFSGPSLDIEDKGEEIIFTGVCDLEHQSTYIGRLNPYLIPRNTSYGKTPKQVYRTWELLTEFSDWLTVNVLDYIKSFPEQDLLPVEPIIKMAYPEWLPSLYTICEERDLERIKRGQDNEPYEQYALAPSARLLNLDVSNDGTFNPDVYDGYLWCKVGAIPTDIPSAIGNFWVWNHRCAVTVKPKYANEIYIVDAAPQDRWKKNLFETHPDLQRMNNEQYTEYLRIIARSDRKSVV